MVGDVLFAPRTQPAGEGLVGRTVAHGAEQGRQGLDLPGLRQRMQVAGIEGQRAADQAHGVVASSRRLDLDGQAQQPLGVDPVEHVEHLGPVGRARRQGQIAFEQYGRGGQLLAGQGEVGQRHHRARIAMIHHRAEVGGDRT